MSGVCRAPIAHNANASLAAGSGPALLVPIYMYDGVDQTFRPDLLCVIGVDFTQSTKFAGSALCNFVAATPPPPSLFFYTPGVYEVCWVWFV